MEQCCLLVFGLVAGSYTCFSQTISLDVRNAPLDAVLQSIAKQTGYAYLADSVSFEETLPVSVHFQSKTLIEALDIIFNGQLVTYVLQGHSIRVRRREQEQADSPIELQEVEVKVSNGYSHTRKSQSTGAFDHVGVGLLSRKPGGDFMKRLEHTTASLLVNHGDAAQTDAQLIRGRGTIYADARPLVVLDHFPYDGDLANLNPDDFLSVDVLKDAAAASLWGARAANGVIVISTKKGTTPNIQINVGSQFSLQGRPNLYNINTISSADYIELEKQMFNQHFYAADELSPAHAPLTPVVELLIAKRDGKMPADEADTQIEALKQQDVRKDISRYLYQPAVTQRYTLDVSGKATKTSYYFSASRDQGTGSLVGERADRFTFRAAGSSRPLKQLELQVALQYAAQNSSHGANAGYAKPPLALKSLYPYARLADDQGNGLPLYLQYRQGFVADAESQGLLNWEYKPLDDITQEDHRIKRQDALLQTLINYQLGRGLSASITYQYEDQRSFLLDDHRAGSYFARDLVNDFAQIGADGTLGFPVPKGGIRDQDQSKLASHQGRMQLNYHHEWPGQHQVEAFVGYEIKHLQNSGDVARLYGYDASHAATDNQLNFDTEYPAYHYPADHKKIENPQAIRQLTDHFLSSYVQASYAYRQQYYLSGSIRKDAANLFGAKANQKGSPFWSLGAKWRRPHISLRASIGTQGNIARDASAYTTALPFQSSLTKLDYLYIVSPSNDLLSWERTTTLNAGLDIPQLFGCISGNVDVYRKTAHNLLGEIYLDPTVGTVDQELNSYYLGNTAGMTSKGIEVALSGIRYSFSGLSWKGTLWFSYVRSVVSAYATPVKTVPENYLTTSHHTIQPVVGKPLSAMYSFAWGGLDGQNGNPIGFFGGQPATDWNTIYTKTPLSQLVYEGPATPTRYGALLNEFQYNQLSLSFNISYQGGYAFRKGSISYSKLLKDWDGHGEYGLRWQQPGDEQRTQVPSFAGKNDPYRDNFYQYASVNSLKGDHLQAEDIRLGYAFKKVEVYLYIRQPGLLWTANKAGIDPDYNNLPAESRQYTLGLKAML